MASANFYNDSAKMIGIDFHHAQLPPTGLSEMVTGHRQDDWPYVVVAVHGWPTGDESKRTPKVTADGQKMIRDGFTISNVPHVTPPLWPYQAIEAAKIVSDSKTTPFLKAPTVTSAGDPLSVCAVVSVGANLNCQDDGMKLSGVVFCTCSVKTAPQMKDLLFRIFDDFLKKRLAKWLTGLFDLLVKSRKIPPPFRQMLVWLFEKVITKVIDWMENLTKWLWDRAVEASKDPQLPAPSEDPTLPEPPPEDWQEQRRRRLEQEQKDAEERQRRRDEERQRQKNNPWYRWW